MSTLHYIFYQCQNPLCGLRFPAQVDSLVKEHCPRCKASLIQAVSTEILQEADDHFDHPKSQLIEALLDNIRSAWNVGSMFRTADGAGIQQLYLCGITPTPFHPQVRRSALGSETTISWRYSGNAVILAQSLISNGQHLWVLENESTSVNLFDMEIDLDDHPIVLVVGNEVAGVDPGLLELAEHTIAIPMIGLKRSYNVAVAFGIAASYLRYCQSFSQESTRKLPKI